MFTLETKPMDRVISQYPHVGVVALGHTRRCAEDQLARASIAPSGLDDALATDSAGAEGRWVAVDARSGERKIVGSERFFLRL
jgi:hypothetical protein